MNGLFSLLKRFNRRMNRKPRSRPAKRAQLGFEGLEDRCVPASITEFSALPTLNSAPMGITKAFDGSVWFTERSANKLGRLSSTGVLTEYAIPTANSAPEQLTASPDGYVWFTQYNGRKIGRISQSGGAISEFTLPGYGERPTTINYTGGKVWFASVEQPSVARLGWISSSGAITKLSSANTAASITSLTTVPGTPNTLWVTRVSSQWGDSVSKVVVNSTSATWTHYKTPLANSKPTSITVGSDGNLWFTEYNHDKIGKITTAGAITEYALAPNSRPQTIVSAPNGNLYFTMKTGNKVGQITTTGVVTEYGVPTAASQPHGITVGADGNLWFTELSGNKVGKLVL